MGKYITAEEIKALTTVPNLKLLTIEQIETLYIVPAERSLENAFDLELETSQIVPPTDRPEDIPCRRRAEFDNYPSRKKMYFADCKLAILFMVQRVAINPEGLVDQSVGGVSATFGKSMPSEVTTIMKRWKGMDRRIFRT